MHRLALLVVTVAGSACADSGDEGFFIRHNLAPTPGCLIAPGGAFLSRGEIELDSPNPYVLTPEVESRITAADGQAAQRRVALRGARVELTVESMTVNNVAQPPPELPNPKFTSLFSASLEPLGTAAVAFDAISAATLGDLASQVQHGPSDVVRIQVLAKATLFGNLGGAGGEIEGVPFYYPITVCTNCVGARLGTCPLPSGTVVRKGNECNPYQDGSVDCCTSSTNELVCPAPTATAVAP